MVNWDDVRAMQGLDLMNLFGALQRLPEQCEEAWQLAKEVELPDTNAISNILVAGTGGSAAEGELLRVFCSSRVCVPVTVDRGYILPEFVGEDTLVFVTCRSGNNKEILSVYDEARSKGAALIIITPGGILQKKALGDSVPVITVPSGISLKVTMGYFFLPMLCMLERLGFLSELSGEIADLLSHLKIIREKLKPEIPEAENQAKQLARLFYNRIPVIWGSEGITEVIARRWKEQVNINARAPAYYNFLPELNYSEAAGFQVPGELLKQLFVVILRDPYDHPRVQRSMDNIKEIIKETVAGVYEVNTSGSTTLARTYTLLYIGDYTSAYLAALYGSDSGRKKHTAIINT